MFSQTGSGAKLPKPEDIQVPDVIDASHGWRVVRRGLEPTLEVVGAFVDAGQATDSKSFVLDNAWRKKEMTQT